MTRNDRSKLVLKNLFQLTHCVLAVAVNFKSDLNTVVSGAA